MSDGIPTRCVLITKKYRKNHDFFIRMQIKVQLQLHSVKLNLLMHKIITFHFKKKVFELSVCLMSLSIDSFQLRSILFVLG